MHRLLPLLTICIAPLAMADDSVPLRSLADTADTGVHYDIKARLMPAGKLVQGQMSLQLRNTARVPISEVRFHLYLNAFSGPDSLFIKKGHGRMRFSRFDPSEPGWIKVRSVSRGQTVLKQERLEDGTVMRVPLDRPLAPGAELELSLTFKSRLPRVFARTGFSGDFFMVAQWYPKLAFLDIDGVWRARPYHPYEEYFAPFASYRVALEVPAGFQVAAPGRRNGNAFEIDGVHDFAFAAWPAFVQAERAMSGVRVSLNTVPGRGAEERIFTVAGQGLDRLQRWFFPYPYRRLTVVDVPTRALGAAGMEYPTLFTTWTPRWVPGWHHGVDVLVLHELAHQYFQGMVASNEVDEPWLDEGMTTYVTGLMADEMYGADSSILGLGPLRLGHHQLRRLSSMRAGHSPLAVGRAARSFESAHKYSRTVYSRAALLLATVESLVGRQAMLRALGGYARRFAFDHPGTTDLTAALVAAAPAPVKQVVRQLVDGVVHGKGDQALDYTVSCQANLVKVTRKVGPRLPLELTLRLRGGRTRILKLDSVAREAEFRVDGLEGADLGPARRLGLDPTPLDLACEVDGGVGARGAAWQWTSLLQLIMQVLGP